MSRARAVYKRKPKDGTLAVSGYDVTDGDPNLLVQSPNFIPRLMATVQPFSTDAEIQILLMVWCSQLADYFSY